MPSTTDRCSFCGAFLEEIELPKFMHNVTNGVKLYQDCDCIGATTARATEAAKRVAELRSDEEKAFRCRLQRAGIRKRYLEANHPDAPKLTSKVLAGESVYLVGSFGTGKTYLACAIARKLIENGRKVRFTTSIDMLREIQSTYGSVQSESEVLERYSRCQVLVIDDLGKEAPTEWALSRLFVIINDRDADMLPTVITSNYRLSELTGRMDSADPSTAEALASRLAGMCEVVEVMGDDRRLR